jgi:hypothetical protein
VLMSEVKMEGVALSSVEKSVSSSASPRRKQQFEKMSINELEVLLQKQVWEDFCWLSAETRQQALLQSNVVRSLADGGAKIKSTIATIQELIQQKQTQQVIDKPKLQTSTTTSPSLHHTLQTETKNLTTQQPIDFTKREFTQYRDSKVKEQSSDKQQMEINETTKEEEEEKEEVETSTPNTEEDEIDALLRTKFKNMTIKEGEVESLLEL